MTDFIFEKNIELQKKIELKKTARGENKKEEILIKPDTFFVWNNTASFSNLASSCLKDLITKYNSQNRSKDIPGKKDFLNNIIFMQNIKMKNQEQKDFLDRTSGANIDKSFIDKSGFFEKISNLNSNLEEPIRFALANKIQFIHKHILWLFENFLANNIKSAVIQQMNRKKHLTKDPFAIENESSHNEIKDKTKNNRTKNGSHKKDFFTTEHFISVMEEFDSSTESLYTFFIFNNNIICGLKSNIHNNIITYLPLFPHYPFFNINRPDISFPLYTLNDAKKDTEQDPVNKKISYLVDQNISKNSYGSLNTNLDNDYGCGQVCVGEKKVKYSKWGELEDIPELELQEQYSKLRKFIGSYNFVPIREQIDIKYNAVRLLQHWVGLRFPQLVNFYLPKQYSVNLTFLLTLIKLKKTYDENVLPHTKMNHLTKFLQNGLTSNGNTKFYLDKTFEYFCGHAGKTTAEQNNKNNKTEQFATHEEPYSANIKDLFSTNLSNLQKNLNTKLFFTVFLDTLNNGDIKLIDFLNLK